MLGRSITTSNRSIQLLIQSSSHLSTGASCSAKTNITRGQVKVFGKLFGARVSGSKKRWYPTTETNTSQSSFLFNPNKFGTMRKNHGKNTIRRMAVLNKLFMEHITDFLATGEISEKVLGRGLQVSGVKISPDFAFITVLWAGNGTPSNDIELEKELQRCSGALRHELSQLCLMGEIPRINFVHDKSMAGLAEVEALLRSIDYAPDYKEEQLKREFFWEKLQSNESVSQATASNVGELVSQVTANNADESDEPSKSVAPRLPDMRHDVLGLDHRSIMIKILTKMRRSKQAWELHEKDKNIPPQELQIVAEDEKEKDRKVSLLECVHRKLVKTVEVESKFDKFLNNRRPYKNTPERKRFCGYDESLLEEKVDVDFEEALSRKYEYMNDENDYIDEEADEMDEKR